MARDREIVCTFYVCEGTCTKGKEATFRKTCQHCSKYRKKEGASPARVDKRKIKQRKISNKEFRRGDW